MSLPFEQLIGDLAPGESKEIEVAPEHTDQIRILELSWFCEGCLHTHAKIVMTTPPQTRVDIACPCCTSWWKKFKIALRSLLAL